MFLVEPFWPVVSYLAYAGICFAVTFGVARTLRRHIPKFFQSGDEQKDRVNEAMTSLLLMGYYLLNYGAICIAMKTSTRINGELDAVELLSFKVGVVLLVQGVVHFLILAKLFAARREHHVLTPTPFVPKPEFRTGR